MKLFVNTTKKRWGTGSVSAPQQQYECSDADFDALVAGKQIPDYTAIQRTGAIQFQPSKALQQEARLQTIEDRLNILEQTIQENH